MPTGATVAALTTSLPETPGGERNWDYRYTWIRDSTFTLQALHYLNLDWEADEFMQFIADLERNEDGGLQIMYGIDGRRDLTETLREDLSGYAGARPVRIGNGAFDQRQNDVFGAALDSVLLHAHRSQRLPRRLWPLIQAQAECATAVWRNPDQGIWEARGKPQHYVSSKLMCWVALDRAAKLAQIRGEPALAAAWAQTAEEIKADILEHGVDKRGVLRQHYATDSLDASTLLAAMFGFLPGGDERLRASVLAIADELTENGFVLRYRTDETDDGLSGKEGTFVICSFWLVSALAIIGETQRARDLMDAPAKVASPLGLYAEEFDVDTGRHLGNFPQAFSHLALVEAAARIILAERLKEIGRMSDSYDVIVIGSGAGGGTLVHRLAPVGQADPAARARRLAAARAAELAAPRTCSWRTATSRRTPGTTPMARRSSRRSTTASAAPPSVRSRAVPAARAGLRRAASSRRGLARVADLLRRHGAVLHAGRAALPGARRTRRGPDRAAGERALPVPRGLARAAYPAAVRRPRQGRAAPVPRAVRGPARRGATCRSASCVRCDNCDGFPCLVHAKSDAEVIAVRPAIEHPNVTLLTDAEAVRLEMQRRRHGRDRRGGQRTVARGDVPRRPRGRLVRGRQQRQAAAGLGDRRSTRAGSPTAPTRSGATSCSTTARRCWRCPRKRTRPSSRRRSGSTTSTSRAPRTSSSRSGNIQMVGKSQAAMFRGEKPGETRFAPEWTLREVARHAVDFWLSTEDLPRPDNRVTLDARRQAPASATGPRNEEPKERLYHQLKEMLADLGMHHGHLLPHHAYLKNEIPVAGCAHQAGTSGSAPTPRARCSIPTAGRTSSTTCTSSTRASSRVSARSTRR